eukprot:TRINITY_DN13474_c0_g1_i2.p1 TRINITY_DN13474_c0_g1~~TRINITY_DN13474_c0_g1_i2.p1  ORF type:complete len:215 (-),score=18.75 TRINITY_DN13474_c0_g1_i2:94-717(-)
MAGTNESRADLTYLDDPLHALLCQDILRTLILLQHLTYTAARDAWAEHPFELLLVAFGCATIRHGFIMLVRFGLRSCCRHSRTSIAEIFGKFCSLSSRWVWLGSLIALACAASMQRSEIFFRSVLIAMIALDLSFNSGMLAMLVMLLRRIRLAMLLRRISIILCCSAVAVSIYLAADDADDADAAGAAIKDAASTVDAVSSACLTVG